MTVTRTSCPTADTLTAFYDGRLVLDEHFRIARHLRDCPHCRERSSSVGRAVPTRRDFPPTPHDTPLTNAPPVAEPRQDRVGPYRIGRLIGRGGMGAVYEAVHERLDRTVAIKLLPRPVAADPEYQTRFEREIRAVGRLDHPNVVRATDAGEADGVLFLVMDLMAGVDLARLLRTLGPLPVSAACQVVRQAAAGLAHAHARGIIHRDVKPSNLMVTPDGTVKVLDLGLVLFVTPPTGHREDPLTGPTFLGTHDYMSPEQWERPTLVDAKADVYGLGCVLYQAIVGRPPFAHEQFPTPGAKRRGHLSAAVELAGVELPPAVASLIERMLAKEAADRPTAAEVAEALRESMAETSVLPRLVERVLLAPGSGFSDGGPTTEAEALSSTRPATVIDKPLVRVRQRPWWPFVLVGVAVILAVLAALVWWPR